MFHHTAIVMVELFNSRVTVWTLHVGASPSLSSTVELFHSDLRCRIGSNHTLEMFCSSVFVGLRAAADGEPSVQLVCGPI